MLMLTDGICHLGFDIDFGNLWNGDSQIANLLGVTQNYFAGYDW